MIDLTHDAAQPDSPSPPKRPKLTHTPSSSDKSLQTETDSTPSRTPSFQLSPTVRSSLSPTIETEPPQRRISIYLESFEEMLKTVLEFEVELFNEEELNLFKYWDELSYEAKYLYVRLFLRKSLHFRLGQLNYEKEIGDVTIAAKELSKSFGEAEAEEEKAEVVLDSDGWEVIPPELLCDEPRREETTRLEGTLERVKEIEPSFGTVENAMGLDRLAMDENSLVKGENLDLVFDMVSLEELKTLAKQMKVNRPGTTRESIIKALKFSTSNQSTLFRLPSKSKQSTLTLSFNTKGQKQTQSSLLSSRLLKILGPSISLNSRVKKLFLRCQLIFFKSLVLDDRTLTDSLLARFKKRNFPEYKVERSLKIFENRSTLMEYEGALRIEKLLEDFLGESTESWKGKQIENLKEWREEGLKKGLALFELIWPVWSGLVKEVEGRKEGEYYKNRFHPVYKGIGILGKLGQHEREAEVLRALLAQKSFRRGKRGAWYDRLALVIMHYFPDNKEEKRLEARDLCLKGLKDPFTHLIYHDSLKRRILRLESLLKVPPEARHLFDNVTLLKPTLETLKGEKLSANEIGKKTVWRGLGGNDVNVEELVREWYVRKGWKGFHSENGILTTLFAVLFWDILFLPVPGAFETPYQSGPLDLPTDAFYVMRATQIKIRLKELEAEEGKALEILNNVDVKERERLTWCVGMKWKYEREDLEEIIKCMGGKALATICRVFAEEWGHRVGGIPDLCLWNMEKKSCIFIEVKGPGDHLSETQKVWNHVLLGAGIKVVLCSVKEFDFEEVEEEVESEDAEKRSKKVKIKKVKKKRKSSSSARDD